MRQLLLDRLDLELALTHVLEILGRTEEHVHERSGERQHETEQRRNPDEPRILDAAARVLEDPVGERDPEDRGEDDEQVAGFDPRHRRTLPIRYPAANAPPTITTSTTAAKAKTPSFSLTLWVVARIAEVGKKIERTGDEDGAV